MQHCTDQPFQITFPKDEARIRLNFGAHPKKKENDNKNAEKRESGEEKNKQTPDFK